MPFDTRHIETYVRPPRLRPLSYAEIVHECRMIAPDFAISDEVSRHGQIVTGRCTLHGKRLELSLVVGEPMNLVQTYLHIAENALRSLRSQVEPHAVRPLHARR